jgi:hypothetical protein
VHRQNSYMRIILPENISERIGEFLIGKQNFPFVEGHELMCILFLYGKSNIVDNNGKWEVLDLATETVNKFYLKIESCKNSPKTKMDTEFIRSGYCERELQIRTDDEQAVQERIVNDPIMLSNCFVQHVSYYNQEYFFQIYGPLKGHELLKDLRNYLEGRTIMLGFNRKNEKSLPFQHPIMPLYVWLREHAIGKK